MRELLTWNVYKHDANTDKIVIYNIFSHGGFTTDLIKIKAKCKDFDEFSQAVKHSLMSYCWSRCEWEVVVGAWVGGTAEEKIDAYDQIIMNWDIFISYLWSNRNLITKKNLGLER